MREIICFIFVCYLLGRQVDSDQGEYRRIRPYRVPYGNMGVGERSAINSFEDLFPQFELFSIYFLRYIPISYIM